MARPRLRQAGLDHRAALRKLAARLGLDDATLQRTLRRAEVHNGPTWAS